MLGAISDFASHIDWIPVDITAQTIVDIVTTIADEQYSVYNLVNPHRVSWSILPEILCNAGVLAPNYKTIPPKKWIVDMENAKNVDKRSLALLPYLSTVAEGDPTRHFLTDKTKKISPTFAKCLPFNEDCMKLSIEFWRRDGFLP